MLFLSFFGLFLSVAWGHCKLTLTPLRRRGRRIERALILTLLLLDVYPGLIASGVRTSPDWTYTRWTVDRFNKAPVQSVTSDRIRCNEDPARPIAKTLTVQAGNVVGFYTDSAISHQGPLLFYMAKVPAGASAASWNGTGAVWFKVFEDGPTIGQWGQMSWPSTGESSLFIYTSSSLTGFSSLVVEADEGSN